MKNDATFYEKAMAAVADPCRMSILQEISKKGTMRCCDVVNLTGPITTYLFTPHQIAFAKPTDPMPQTGT